MSVTFQIEYSDGSLLLETFASVEDAKHYVMMDGDHVVNAQQVQADGSPLREQK